MKVRWWRVGVVLERGGDPWTWTLHVRAFTERNARRIAGERVGVPHAIYACVGSDPLMRVEPHEAVVADYGPYRRSWDDPQMTALRDLIRLEAGPG